MLSLAEYQAYANDLQILGQQTDQSIEDSLVPNIAKQDAIKRAKSFIPQYQKAMHVVMDQAMYEISTNALHHYQTQLSIPLPQDIINDVIRDQYTKKYYGATLNQRLLLTRLRLNRVITQTAQTGIHNLGGLFSNSIPFGAQTTVSRRLLQGTAIKIERDVAMKVADVAKIPLIRWTLAKGHAHQCACEDLARHRDKKIERYLDQHNLDYEAEGLFFADKLPDPPHPNCQCEFNLVGDSETVPSRGFRPLHALRRLIRKLLG